MKKLLLLLAPVIAFAGQGLDLSAVRAYNLVTAQSHSGGLICEGEISDISGAMASDGVFEGNAFGVTVDYSDSTHLRFQSLFSTGDAPSVLTTAITQFVDGYLKFRWQRDNAGTIPGGGVAKTYYLETWDHFGVSQPVQTIVYTGDNGYNSPDVYIGQTSNHGLQRIHFMRCGTTLVAIGSRPPATADVGPLNSGSWVFHGKFDGSLIDSVSGNPWPWAMQDASTPSSSCGSTATSYCPTLYQNAVPVITNITTTWRAGSSPPLSGTGSYSDADSSAVISSYFWQMLSAPNLPVWSSHTASGPSLTGIIAGDHNVLLQVTDAGGVVASTTQHIGAVATDANDIVINSASLPANSITDIILGPLQKWMSSLAPYPLFDVLHRVQWGLRSGPSGDFQLPVNGGSSYQSGIAYFDYAQAGTLSVSQFSNMLTGVGTAWTTTACSSGSSTAQALITTSVEAGIHTSDTFTFTGSNNVLPIAYDGGSTTTVTLTTGSRTILQVVQDIATALGTGGTINGTGNCSTAGTCKVFVLFNGFIAGFQSLTAGSGGSVQIVSSGCTACATLGLTPATYTVASTPQANMDIIPWYLTSTLTPPNPAYPTGRRQLNVLACLSDTSMVIEQGSGLNWRFPSQTGIQYALDNQSYGIYNFFSNNGNYYGTDLSDYSKAMKSGVIADLTQARARADRWFRQPALDLGQEWTTSGDSTTITGSGRAPQEARLTGLTGVILRALDGPSQYWTGLEYEFAVDVAKLTSAGSNIMDQFTDQRNWAYTLQRVSLCAMFDPNSYAATCRAALVSHTAAIVTPSLNTVDTAYPYFPALYYNVASFAGTPSSVCVINGSPTVTITGFTFSPAVGAGTYLWFFPTPGTRPANNAAGDAQAYQIGGFTVTFSNGSPVISATNTLTAGSIVTFTTTGSLPTNFAIATQYYVISTGLSGSQFELSASPGGSSISAGSAGSGTQTAYSNTTTTLKLSTNYVGTSGCTGTSGSNKGWLMYDTAAATPSYVGWGCQPFMCGLLGQAFAWASLATTCTSTGVPTNCDNPTSNLLKTYTSYTAQWLANIGYDSVTQGVYQGASYVNCNPPSSSVNCNTGDLPYGERVVAQESGGGESWAFRLSGTSAFKTNLDAQFSAAWSTAGGLPDYNCPSGMYCSTPGVTASEKYYGLQAGIAGQPSYQAVRTCTVFPCLSPVIAPVTRTIYVNYSPSDISGAFYLHIVVTAPNGTQTTTTCTTAPCAVTGDLRQGTVHTMQATYFSGGGKQLAQTGVDLLTVQ